MSTESSKDQLWLTNLVVTKALASALVKRGILNKDDILAELAKSSASDDAILENAIKDAVTLVENIGE